MLKLPSLQKEYSLVFSGDPALSLPEDEAERANALRVARETGRWHDICHANQQPTIFHMRPIGHSAFEWLIGESVRRKLTQLEMGTLAMRLAWSGVENLDGFGKIETVLEDEHRLVKRDVIDRLVSIGGEGNKLGLEIIAELSSEAMRRTTEGVSPKR